MSRSTTPEIVVTNNSTSQHVTYVPTVTKSQTPTVTNIKAGTNLVLEYYP